MPPNDRHAPPMSGPEQVGVGMMWDRLFETVDQMAQNQQTIMQQMARYETNIEYIKDSVKTQHQTIQHIQQSVDAQDRAYAKMAGTLEQVDMRVRDQAAALRRLQQSRAQETTQQAIRTPEVVGDGWLSVQGIIKIIAAVGTVVGAYVGGTYTQSERNSHAEVRTESSYGGNSDSDTQRLPATDGRAGSRGQEKAATGR